MRGCGVPAWASGAGVGVLVLSMLLALPWERGHVVHEFQRVTAPSPNDGPRDTATYQRRNIILQSHGTNMSCWLYTPKPKAARSPPVIIMAHGIGAQKDMGLDMYGAAFAEAGFAVVVLDYRTFGGSEGEPRHWVSPSRHIQDIIAAVEHVKATNLGGAVDGTRIALWGVSYGGGHVLTTASRLGANISAVVANEPFLSSNTALANALQERGLGRTLRLLAAAISDELRARLGLAPVYIRLTGALSDRTTLALVPLKDSEVTQGTDSRDYTDRLRRIGGWKNLVLARVVLEALGYRPVDHIHKVRAPVFLRVALQDHLCPPEVLLAAAKTMRAHVPEVVVQQRNYTHIGAHKSGTQPEEFAPVVAFLHKHLGVSSPQQPDQPSTPGGESVEKLTS